MGSQCCCSDKKSTTGDEVVGPEVRWLGKMMKIGWNGRFWGFWRLSSNIHHHSYIIWHKTCFEDGKGFYIGCQAIVTRNVLEMMGNSGVSLINKCLRASELQTKGSKNQSGYLETDILRYWCTVRVHICIYIYIYRWCMYVYTLLVCEVSCICPFFIPTWRKNCQVSMKSAWFAKVQMLQMPGLDMVGSTKIIERITNIYQLVTRVE